MSETETENPEVEPVDGDEPDDAREEAEREAEQEAELARAPRRETTQAQLQKAERANQQYHRKLAEILGEDESRHECAACTGLGVTWGEPEAPPELVHPETYVACAGCNGFGMVESGSKHPDYAVVVCTECAGKGYNIVAAQVPFTPTVVPTGPAAAQTLQGQYVPGRGFIPYGSDEPLPGSFAG